MTPALAVIDIGSNSIKLLVGTQNEHLLTDLIGTRLILENGQLTDMSMQEALVSIKKLSEKAQPFHPTKTVIVATSAVRDAKNKEAFTDSVLKATGHKLRILTGEEEAYFIAQGVASDKNLEGCGNFYLFDLGGGSLELILFKDGKIADTRSLSLGAVRLSELFIKDKNKPINKDTLQTIKKHTRECIKASGFNTRESLPLIAMGGGLSTALNILGNKHHLKIFEIKNLLNHLSSQTLEERLKDERIPKYRADVLPTALGTILAVAEVFHAEELTYSPYNLRFGLLNLWAKGQLSL